MRFTDLDHFDIAFCTNFNCQHKDCRRHPINTPSDLVMIWRSDFKTDEDGNCQWYWKWRD